MNERELLQEEIKKLNGQIEILNRQIENSDRNITGLVAQKTRHMDRRDLLEGKKAKLEAELALIPEEEAGV
jgi:chromosome segregation ATPase